MPRPGKLWFAESCFKKRIGCQAADRVGHYSCPERKRSHSPTLRQRELLEIPPDKDGNQLKKIFQRQ